MRDYLAAISCDAHHNESEKRGARTHDEDPHSQPTNDGVGTTENPTKGGK